MIENKLNKKNNVRNVAHFNLLYTEIVHKIVHTRKQANLTQENIAELINCDRRKIINIESLKKIDIETLLLYADKLSIDINISYEVN